MKIVASQTWAMAVALAINECRAWVPSSQTSAMNMIRTPSWMPSSSQLFSTDSESDQALMGLNELQTLLREAVKKEDFDEAIKLRDILAERVSSGAYSPKSKGGDNNTEEDKRKMKRLSWRGLGTAGGRCVSNTA